MKIKAGDHFAYRKDMSAVAITVTCVSQDGKWADILCCYGGAYWSKRQSLPFPETFRYIPSELS